jgi:NAD(P)-dependent dehydrogenase (short-subunit alcohol dehydrogenase family)
MAGSLKDKVIVITGAASGIGRATALICAREGAKVVVADRDRAGGEQTVGMARDAGGEASFVAADVSNEEQVNAMVAHAVATYGRLDGAFNNAAIGEAITGLLDETNAMYDSMMDVNVRGVWLCLRAQIRQMQAQGGGGAIVNTSSAAGIQGTTKMAIYGATKHAVIGLTKAAALEFARNGLRVNAVCPGVIETPMLMGVIGQNERLQQGFMASQPNRRFGQPEEIGEAVAWLLSDAASLVTGIAMSVDGGLAA